MPDLREDKNKQSLGKLGEEIAAAYLGENGCRVVERNYRFSRMGEIDIIALEKEYICFIEVKTRTSSLYGEPCEAVNVRKQQNIRKLAWTYLKQHQLTNKNVRFDIIEITGEKRGGDFVPGKINMIRNAF